MRGSAGNVSWKKVWHQDYRLSCTVYHRTCVSAAWKDLSWSPVTEAVSELSRPQDKTQHKATLLVTLPLPVDDKPGRGELAPSCYQPTAHSEDGATTLSQSHPRREGRRSVSSPELVNCSEKGLHLGLSAQHLA